MAHRNPGKADGRSHALRRHDNIVGYLFMLPALLFFCCFIIIPMLTGFVTSLFDYTMKTPVSMETFVGLRNYAELFTTPTFYRALLNTLLIVVVAVPTVTLARQACRRGSWPQTVCRNCPGSAPQAPS